MNKIVEAGTELYIFYQNITSKLRLYVYFITNCFSQKKFSIKYVPIIGSDLISITSVLIAMANY